jgi:hypothetical protein
MRLGTRILDYRGRVASDPVFRKLQPDGELGPTPVVRCAQAAALTGGLGERVLSIPLLPSTCSPYSAGSTPACASPSLSTTTPHSPSMGCSGHFAAIPKEGKPKLGSQIASFCFHAAAALARNGRDVGAELWAASGWTPPSQIFAPPPMAQEIADEIGFPIYLGLFNKDIQIRLPKRAHADALLALWAEAPDFERALLVDLARAYSKNEDGFRSDPRLEQLSPELRNVAIDYFLSPEPHGPPHVFIRGTFPTNRYLERLFRTGALTATANLPGEPKAYELSKADWAGLEIACGGDLQRLGVWRTGKVGATGEGVFENVRVARDAVLTAFPADPPPPPKPTPIQATDEDARRVIRDAMASSGGFIPQKEGARIVRKVFPDFNFTRAMELTRELTGNRKPGPRGPRRKSSQ